jgi:hypothetical protein
MPLRGGGVIAHFKVTADVNDALSSHTYFQSCGPGRFRLWIVAAAANDATVTLNDGVSNFVNNDPIPVRAAAVTGPEIRKNEEFAYEFVSRAPDRPRVDLADGTNAEIAFTIQHVSRSIK